MPPTTSDRGGRRRRWAGGALLLVLASWPAGAHAKAKLWDRVLDFLGVTVGPGQVKSGGEADAVAGKLVTKDLSSGAERALTVEGGYRWPVFSVDAKTVYALRGDQLVTIDVASAAATGSRKVAKVEKLVGVDRKQPGKVLVLRKDAAAPIGVLSLDDGKVQALPYDPKDEEQARIVGRLAGEERVYGDTRVFVRKQTKPTMSGTSEWQEIYLQSADAEARAISACAGASCRQPALSADGKRAVWVRAGG